MVRLDEHILREATHELGRRDEALRRVYETYGYPPLWAREPSFSTLAHIILEQQVSLASANATFHRLRARLGEIRPDNFLTLDDDELTTLGITRQKRRYIRLLAENMLAGRFSLDGLQQLDDDSAKKELTRLTGIGDWTADIYLSECLLRPDILPKGDIAMLEAIRVLKQLPHRPSHEQFTALTEHWRPWRSVGTRLLWHFYLSRKR